MSDKITGFIFICLVVIADLMLGFIIFITFISYVMFTLSMRASEWLIDCLIGLQSLIREGNKNGS